MNLEPLIKQYSKSVRLPPWISREDFIQEVRVSIFKGGKTPKETGCSPKHFVISNINYTYKSLLQKRDKERKKKTFAAGACLSDIKVIDKRAEKPNVDRLDYLTLVSDPILTDKERYVLIGRLNKQRYSYLGKCMGVSRQRSEQLYNVAIKKLKAKYAY